MKRRAWATSKLEAAIQRGVIKRWLVRLKIAEGIVWLAGTEAAAIVAAKSWLWGLLDAGSINR